MKKKPKFTLSTTHTVLLSFLLAVIVGSLLLMLPISTKSGESVAYIDALFTATTATCVTGLVTLTTVSTWSWFGQIVILILIQIGGLGIITVMAGLSVILQRKMGLKSSRLIQDAFNLNTLAGLSKFVKDVIRGTFLIEGVGALLYMIVFIPQYGVKGIWISVFNSVSAFCNAGIDIMAEDSLCQYATNPLVNGITSALIILGGIGYVVWWDVIRVLKNTRTQKLKCLRGLTLHSKIVLTSTAALLFGGFVLILLFEYNNPLTIGNYSLFDKMQVAFFQSVTTRTAGFASVPQGNLTNATSIVCLVLMFIGGSPVGTAGGIKTVTMVVLGATAVSVMKNKSDVTLFNRTISRELAGKAVAVTCTSFIILLISTVSLAAVTADASALDILYETVSATATVGLTRNLTPTLNIWGRMILIATMYFGRVGPISLVLAFSVKKEVENNIKDPIEDVSVG